MSRVGKKPIPIPVGVKVNVSGSQINVKGPLGCLDYCKPVSISVNVDGNNVIIQRATDEPSDRALHGLVRALVANMITGVATGFSKSLLLEGVGYKVSAKGDSALVLSVGFSHQVEFVCPKGVTVTVDKAKITLKGIDKQLVGQAAANVRSIKKVEPYKGKGFRYENEKVRIKEGKTGT